MFISAIETVAAFTRPIHSLVRNYGSSVVQPGAATLFFVNSDGWALTCAHVAKQLTMAESLAQKAELFQKELSSLRGTQKEKRIVKELEKKYGYTKSTTYELHNRFIDCVEGKLSFTVMKHTKYDVALIKFREFDRLVCSRFPIFPADTSPLKQGKMLCRLGFPFPEFTNYAYDGKADKVSWTDTGRMATPRFPIEGMMTRGLLDETGIAFGFEMSTPGLRGQSGGPAFDYDGKVWGLQYATNHLDLDFDINQEVLRQGNKKHITDSAFLHVGLCVHVDILKAFMKENGVAFTEV